MYCPGCLEKFLKLQEILEIEPKNVEKTANERQRSSPNFKGLLNFNLLSYCSPCGLGDLIELVVPPGLGLEVEILALPLGVGVGAPTSRHLIGL